MPDLDEDLRADAERWRELAPSPPRLSEAVGRVVSSRRVTDRRSGRVLALIAAVAAVVTAIAIAATHLDRSGAPTATGLARQSILVGGKRLPFAGIVPWGNPVTYARDPNVVYVFADNGRAQLTIRTCGITTDRAFSHETATSVRVTVAGYANPVPAGGSCGGPEQAPVAVRIQLQGPLGGRTLIDNAGNPHRILNADAVPTPAAVSAQCSPIPLVWTERTGIAQRGWSGPSNRCDMRLTYGPADVMARLFPPSGRPSGSISISGRTAEIWTYRTQNPPRFNRMLIWSPSPGHQLQLSTGAYHPAEALSYERLLRIARSVH
jgi:hypothetical protein